MTYSNTSIAALAAAAFLGLMGCGDRGADNTGQTNDSGMSDSAPGASDTTGSGDATTGGAAGEYPTNTPPSDANQGGDWSSGSATDPNAGSAAGGQDGATSTSESAGAAGDTTPPQ
jgi:hypothetical protein